MAIDAFNTEIETRAAQLGSYIVAITEYCEEKEMDEYDVAELLHPIVVEKVKTEFRQRNFFAGEKTQTLDEFFED